MIIRSYLLRVAVPDGTDYHGGVADVDEKVASAVEHGVDLCDICPTEFILTPLRSESKAVPYPDPEDSEAGLRMWQKAATAVLAATK